MKRVWAFLLIGLVAALPQGAAVVLTWSGLTGGSFSTGTNWIGNLIPGSGDSIEFTNIVTNTTVSFTGPGTTTVGNLTFSGTSRPAYTFGGTGSPTLSITGDVTLTTAGDVSFASALTLNLANNANRNTFSVVSGSTVTIEGPITGAVGIIKSGAGTLVLAGSSNSYVDPTFVNEGVLSVGSLGTASGTSSLGNDNGISDYLFVRLGKLTTTGTLRYTGNTTVSTNRGIDMAGTTGGATLDSSGTGAVTYSSFRVTGVGAKTLTLTGTNSGTNTVAAVIPDSSSGATSLVKSGTGTWKLTGANTYSGGTSLSGGELIIGHNNALGSGNASVAGARLVIDNVSISNSLSVSSSGKLAGTGSVSNGSILSTGIIAPGGISTNQIGSLSFNDLTLAGGGIYEWNLKNPTGVAGTDWDLVTINSPTTLNISATSGSPFNLKLISLNSAGNVGAAGGFTNQTYLWKIFDTSATSISPAFDATSFTIDSSQFTTNLGSGGTFTFFKDSGTSNLMLSFTPVPEPETYVLMSAGLSLLAAAAWRRKRRS